MKPIYTKNKIISNIEVCNGIYKLSVKGSFLGNPGQFYMLRAWGIEPLLPRPLSIFDMDEDKLSFLYEVKGKGTKILGSLNKENDMELLGPLGNGFDFENIKGRVAIVTGGIGIAPMLYTVKKIKADSIELYAGFRDKSFIIDEFKNNVDNIYISTDSGKEGYRGFITDIFNPNSYDVVLSCGPIPMMEKVVKKCKEGNVPVYISMENHMACGLGACLVCTCSTVSGYKRVCKDGPVFSGEDVMFNA